MRTPSVFISHSAHEPVAEDALLQLVAALENGGFDVLLDRKAIPAGADWRSELRRWLDVCRAAVILFSPSAVASEWVREEVTVLRHRYERAEHFPIIPVLVAGATIELLEGPPWDVSEVLRHQTVAWEPGAPVPVAVRDALAPLLESCAVGAPLDLHELHVAHLLGAYRPDALEAVSQCLGHAHRPAAGDRALAVAQGLLESSAEAQLGALRVLAAVELETAEKVYAAVEPYGLIAPEAAAHLRRMVDRGRGGCAAGINCEHEVTCDLYVRRADSRWWTAEVSSAAWTSESLDEFLECATLELADILAVDPEDDGLLEIDEVLELLPGFVVLPYPRFDKAAAERLRSAFPHLHMLVRRGRSPAVDLDLEWAEYVVPELGENDEPRLLKSRRMAHLALRPPSRVAR